MELDTSLLCEDVSDKVWEAIAQRKLPGGDWHPSIEVVFDTPGLDSWAWLHLPAFELKEDGSTICFEYEENSQLKNDMEWDFIQITKL